MEKGPRIESRFEMAEEDTDWSYSETVPTLSKTMHHELVKMLTRILYEKRQDWASAVEAVMPVMRNF